MTDKPELNAALLPVDVKRIIYLCPTCDKQIPATKTLLTSPVKYQHSCCGNTWTTPYYSGQIIHQDNAPAGDESTYTPADDDSG